MVERQARVMVASTRGHRTMRLHVAHRGLFVAAIMLVIAGGVLARAGLSSASQGRMLVRGNAPGEWRYWGADAWSTRYSPLDQINASNFDSLKVAWQWSASEFGEDAYYRTTQLYANG